MWNDGPKTNASYFKLIVLLPSHLHFTSLASSRKKNQLQIAYLLTPYDSVCTFRFSDQRLLQRFSTETNFDSHAFCSAAPSVWNSLPYPVRASPTVSSFKRALKTHYFWSSFHPSLH